MRLYNGYVGSFEGDLKYYADDRESNVNANETQNVKTWIIGSLFTVCLTFPLWEVA